MMHVTTAPIFAADLTPARAMDPRGMRIVVGLVAVLMLAPGLFFLSVGAWPILSFMGLDLVAIALALHVSSRRSRQRERVSVWPGTLELEATDARGQVRTDRFATARLRLLLERDFYERAVALRLAEGGKSVEIGAFLSREERSGFARVLGRALRQSRR